MSALPIEAVLPALAEALEKAGKAVLVAPPGAGKTTGVPLALLEAPWRADGTILVLEPRRIAARGAASRMASLLGEPLGKRVGLRARFDTKSSRETRILVVTEGVFTRMILDDPALDGIAAVLFDEFHERSLDADLGLALALEAQEALRPDLRLVVMSATLDDKRIATLLGDAPVIASEGRTYPIETRYRGRDPNARIEEQMATAILAAVRGEGGSLLAFLPGQGEIERVARLLEAAKLPEDCDLCPLYGALDSARQDAAIRPSPPGRRKIVLATSIAETSLTIEGVRIVVDSGLQRSSRYEPDLGISRLETVRASRASADQRRGRAGRTEPGIAIRLWDQAQDQGLLPFNRAEILDSDLSGFRLDCAAWGVVDLTQLRLLDPPPAAALKEAEALLGDLGALDAIGRITPRGRALRRLPLEPRLAALVLEGARLGMAQEAAEIAALIGERGIGGVSTDLADRLSRLQRDRSPRASAVRSMAARWAGLADAEAGKDSGNTAPLSTGGLLALAFPDRVAKARGNGMFHLANGRLAAVDAADALAGAAYLVVADMTGSAAKARITLAATIAREEIGALFGDQIVAQDEIIFDRQAEALRRRRVVRLKALTLESATLPVEANAATAAALAKAAAARGIDRLGWSKAQIQLRDRAAFLKQANPNGWPDLSDAALAETAEEWLAPFLDGMTSLAAITPDVLGAALDMLLPYALRQRLDREAPTHFVAPTGNAHPIRYEGEGAPFLAIRVQELFGQKQHPAIAEGRLKLTLELLSPAHRPIQITRDLPGFWAGSWADVRSEMRGRYPRHVWPEDPANAAPTARAKPRGT
ncbi:MAG: ATP-dependent helicase [Beijerinckiaceae bacterium]|nr:MAG: ATP-dependent helicase [Beijerinckiaceae bacterium]